MPYFTTLICLTLAALITFAAYCHITQLDSTHDRILRRCARKFPKQRVTVTLLSKDGTWRAAYLRVDNYVVVKTDGCTSADQALKSLEELVFDYGE
jgi:hypothetical protein